MSAPLLGRPLWYELMTTDRAAAESFYKTVVGWTTAPFDGSPQPYTMWMRGETPVGGVMTIPDELKAMGVPPHWMMYIGVPKLEDATAHVERLGGSIVSPIIDVPTVGRMRAMRMRRARAFSIYQPATPPADPEALPELGDASWHELYTTDGEAAMKFYQTLFGWKSTETMDMGPMGKYHMFGRELGSMGGMMNKTAGDGPRADGVVDLFPRARRACGGGAGQGERRQDHQRADGSPGRRLDRPGDGSAGRGVRVAPQEASVGCLGRLGAGAWGAGAGA